jgi:hypothetical protein
MQENANLKARIASDAAAAAMGGRLAPPRLTAGKTFDALELGGGGLGLGIGGGGAGGGLLGALEGAVLSLERRRRGLAPLLAVGAVVGLVVFVAVRAGGQRVSGAARTGRGEPSLCLPCLPSRHAHLPLPPAPPSDHAGCVLGAWRRPVFPWHRQRLLRRRRRRRRGREPAARRASVAAAAGAGRRRRRQRRGPVVTAPQCSPCSSCWRALPSSDLALLLLANAKRFPLPLAVFPP